MVSPDEVKHYVGRGAVVRLSPEAGRGSVVTGRIVGALPALDGLVVTIAPDGGGPQQTVHYHHIESIAPAPGE